jgi:squalene synthase HpnC
VAISKSPLARPRRTKSVREPLNSDSHDSELSPALYDSLQAASRNARFLDFNQHRIPKSLVNKHPFLEADLAKFGPESQAFEVMTVAQASDYCRSLAVSHYENFSIASWLLPRAIRPHFHNIYAYCRWSDDLADESPNQTEALKRLDWWQSELDRCFSGEASHPVFIALQSTILAHRLDQKPFNDLLSAFRQDQVVNRYDTDEQLKDYCQRSASPVGRIVLQLANVHSEPCFAWSDSICTSLQLVNFAQDMSRDAAIDRIYMPRARWASYGIDEKMILDAVATEPLCKSVLNWIDDLRLGFTSGWELTNHVPGWLSRDIRLFASGGLAIADAITVKSGDVWSQRIEVSKLSKVWLLMRAMITRKPPRSNRCNNKAYGNRMFSGGSQYA